MTSSSPDIFEFWSGLPGDATVHPADRTVLQRVEHSFQLDCLVGPFRGRLRDAPVVLLFLSPGFNESDRAMAATKQGQDYYQRMRGGEQDLPSINEHEAAHRWETNILRQFGLSFEACKSRVAFLNIGAYKSKSFTDWKLLPALPSCRLTLDWAQGVLFPQAEANERVVVCMRSAGMWGLGSNGPHGSLYAPACTRGGFMLNGSERERVVSAVKSKVDL